MNKFILISLVTLLFFSCSDPGTHTVYLEGDESALPEELKGLKVYSIATGGGTNVKVAILNKQVNSTTYYQNKSNRTTINVQNNNVIYENDSIIILKKY